MPDLNIANPRVREEISKVVGFWLELGLSGFRVDAAPFVIELAGTEPERAEDPHDYLRDLRAFTNRRRGDAILLAEANLPPEEQRRFFGDEGGDDMHMLFNRDDPVEPGQPLALSRFGYRWLRLPPPSPG
jgi:glycosidase